MTGWQLQRLRQAMQLGDISGRDAVWISLMSCMFFLLVLPVLSYVAAIPLIKEEWGLNNTQAGALYGAYMSGFVLTALLVVPLTDRLGARHILIVSAIISVVGHALFPLLARDIVSGMVLRAIAGVGLLGVYTPGVRIIAERFGGGGRGMAVGLFVTAFYAASGASLFIMGRLMSFLDWRDAYLAVALVSAVSTPMAYVLVRGESRGPRSSSSGRLNLGVLKSLPVRYLILGYAAHVVEEHAVKTWLPGFFLAVLVARGAETGEAAATAATIGGIALAAGALGPIIGGTLSDRWGRATSATVILGVSGACAWAIGWTADLPLALILAVGVVYGWSIAADSPIYTTGVTEVADPGHMGSALAVHMFIGQLGGVIGPIAFGGILDLSPEAYEWGLAFSALGVLAIIAIVGLRRLNTLPQSKMLADGKG